MKLDQMLYVLLTLTIVASSQANGDQEEPKRYPCEDRPPFTVFCTGDASEKWYFDVEKKVCKKAYYGCNFTTNSFNTSDECEEVCPPEKYCKLDEPTPSQAILEACEVAEPENFTGWQFDKTSKKCVATSKLTKRTFPSRRHCQASCATYSVCYTNERRLPCKGGNMSLAWYFDTYRKDCFEEPRCNNSKNRFQTREECQGECPFGGEIPECHLEKDEGSQCNGDAWSAPNLRWYYDHFIGECTSFFYKGCGGNDNNYPTKETCNAICLHKSRKQ